MNSNAFGKECRGSESKGQDIKKAPLRGLFLRNRIQSSDSSLGLLLVNSIIDDKFDDHFDIFRAVLER